ncbi:MAG: PAS domain-containing hybrid sensor histidine kinase/response regulator [Pseudomonadota bacterium]
MPAWLILLCGVLYVVLLFAIAARRDKRAQKPGFVQSPTIYALALAVYCTSWTFFGAVGTASSSGWDYLPIYLGPILVFLLMPHFIRRVGRIVQRESITSLSDFLSARYGKSRMVAGVATLAAVAGSLPYIALQLKSVGMSFQALSSGGEVSASPPDETVLLTGFALALFAILFGARYADTTKHNAGLMRVLAFEAIVKLVALFAVCGLSLTLLSGFGGPAPDLAPSPFVMSDLSGRFVTILLLSMGAIICLPRQFHVTMIERRDDKDNARAGWVFPLYLLATAIVVVPITMAGLSVLPAGTSPDIFVLQLPLSSGDGLMAMVVFLGGFSAASGMVIVSTIALSTMVTNDLLVPALMRAGRFQGLAKGLENRLVTLRRLVVVALILLAYVYYRTVRGEALAAIGLVSFAAAIQFAPALIGAVYWRGGQRVGVLAGLVGGISLWAYTLFIPTMIGYETLRAIVPTWLDPNALFGIGFGDPLTHGVVWSLGVNTLLFLVVSARMSERLRDRVQAAAFAGTSNERAMIGATDVPANQTVSPNGLKTLSSRFLLPDAVESAFVAFERETGVRASGDDPADWRLVQRTEKLLASALGASSARVVMTSAIGGVDVALPAVLSMLDMQTRAERFDRHMLQAMLENVSQGISVVDHEQKLVAWNSTYVELFDYPDDLVRVGTPIAELIGHNVDSGWIEGNLAHVAERRVEFMRAGSVHTYERQNPDGRYIRIIGNPTPGGGYVTTFTDITADREREQALREANEQLEARVAARTRELSKASEALDQARQEAEAANASKTRFLAAASHDLLQPLNAARLFLGVLQGQNETDRTVSDIVAKADRSIQSADELLKGLLDISKLDHDGITPDLVDLPIGPLLEDLVDEAEPMARKAGLEIKLAPTRLSVTTDPEFLKSILRNFISNARRYTKSGGILVGARSRGDKVRLEVWDTGPGIPEERIEHLFEEFRRYEDIDNLGLRGAGLGLSVAQRLARLLGTEVKVRSRVGHGSVFSVEIDKSNTTAQTKRAAVEPLVTAPVSLSELRVLCVDDEKPILESLTLLLGAWGCEVSVAATPDEFDRLCLDRRFDAMIADYHLGADRDGVDLVEIFQTETGLSGRALIVTARVDEALESRADALNIPIERKPISAQVLRAFLEECVVKGVQAAE